MFRVLLPIDEVLERRTGIFTNISVKDNLAIMRNGYVTLVRGIYCSRKRAGKS